MTTLNFKEIGAQLKEAKNRAKQLSLATATAAFITLSASSCNSQPTTGSRNKTAKGDFKSGKTEQLIEKNDAKIQEMLAIYNEYFDDYEKRQKKLIALQASGDTKGYQVEWERVQELKKTIENLENEIDDALTKKDKLKTYRGRGRKAAAGEPTSSSTLKRRTFIEAK